GGYAVFTGVASPLTQAIGLGMHGPVSEADLDRLEAFFELRSSPTRVELCPMADVTLVDLLSARGYRLREFSNMLVRPLRGRISHASAEGPVRVQRCSSEEDDLWARTVAKGFVDELTASEENLLVLKSLFHRPDSTCMLAWMDDHPVGGGALAVHEGVAALYGATTLPTFRRRGVQKALILSLLSVAVEGGCDVAYTLTGPGSTSQRNVERQHFHVAYTRSTLIKDIPQG
ncbi:MAG TPA: GNAT family N-acetyltransferase, partial [Bacteroidota bacterium]|nr:GNAT family N-acetyltransferase [Bacteroidota bacterium]